MIDPAEPLTIFDPEYPWKKLTLTDYEIKELQVPVFKNGQCVLDHRPDVNEIRSYSKEQIDLLWDEMKRFEHPHLSKLMDSRIVYCADEKYRIRLESLRDQVRRQLARPFGTDDFRKGTERKTAGAD